MTAPLTAWLFADADAQEEVQALARDAGLRIEGFADVAAAAARYATHPPALLLFAHLDLTLSERGFLELYRTAAGFAGGDHPAIVLCKAHDVEVAYDLVKRGVFDDYVVLRPLYDPHRLAISIRHLLGGRRDQHRAIEGRRLVAGAAQAAAALHTGLTRHAQMSETAAGELGALRQRLATEAPGLSPLIEDTCAPTERRLAASGAEARALAAAQAPTLDAARGWLAEQRQRLAVVDDDPVFLRVLTRMLEQAGYEVSGFTDPLAALAALSRLRPDALLADRKMPGLDGFGLIAEARRIPALAAMPCLLISGHADAETVRAAAGAGIGGFIVKPGKRDLILAKLREVLPPLSSVTPEVS